MTSTFHPLVRHTARIVAGKDGLSEREPPNLRIGWRPRIVIGDSEPVSAAKAPDADRHDPRFEHRDPRQQCRERRAALDPAGASGRARGPAMGDTTAYLLTLGSLILLGGSLGDIFGERRIFALGVGGFGAASLLCAVAPSIGLLIAFRARPGGCRRAADAELAGGDRRDVPGKASAAPRSAPGRRGGRSPARSARSSPEADPERRLVAVDLRDQRAARASAMPVADRYGGLPAAERPTPTGSVDVIGAALCVLGLGGIGVRADRAAAATAGRDPRVLGSADRRRRSCSPRSLSTSRARATRCCGSTCSRAATSRSGTSRRWRSTAVSSALFFFLVLYLQQVAGYSPLESGLALLPESRS